MKLHFKPVLKTELEVVLQLLKDAAIRLQQDNVDQWKHWLKPTTQDIKWIKEGVEKNEFHFVMLESCIGLFRLSNEDPMYWGHEPEAAKYIHSFVIKKSHAGKNIGVKVIDLIGRMALKENVVILRLDCISANRKLCDYYEDQGFNFVREKTLEDAKFNLYEKRLQK